MKKPLSQQQLTLLDSLKDQESYMLKKTIEMCDNNSGTENCGRIPTARH